MTDLIDRETGEIVETAPIDIETSAEIGDLMGALAKAQGEISNAEKDAKNSHFDSKYATLAAVYAACREGLSKAGVAVVAAPYNLPGGEIGVVTMLGHASGQWIKGRIYCKPGKYDAQGIGSVITYLRRYSLSSMVGVAPDDDDGNAAVGRPDSRSRSTATHRAAPPGGTSDPAANVPVADDRARLQADYNELSKAIAGCIDTVELDGLSERHKEKFQAILDRAAPSHAKLMERMRMHREKILAPLAGG